MTRSELVYEATLSRLEAGEHPTIPRPRELVAEIGDPHLALDVAVEMVRAHRDHKRQRRLQ